MAAEVTTSRNRPRHVVAVPVAPGSPVFEVAVPCEVFGVDRNDITPDWYELVLCRTGPAPSALRHGLELTGGGTPAAGPAPPPGADRRGPPGRGRRRRPRRRPGVAGPRCRSAGRPARRTVHCACARCTDRQR